MKIIKIIMSLIFIHSSFTICINTLQAAERDLCICQTGSSKNYELVFFKMGCKAWNMTQSCNEKITISINDSIEKIPSESGMYFLLKIL